MRSTDISFVIAMACGMVIIPAVGRTTSQVNWSSSPGSVARTAKAANYRRANGSMKTDLKGTELMQGASAEAKVESKNNRMEIEVKFTGVEDATKFGLEYFTYVRNSVRIARNAGANQYAASTLAKTEQQLAAADVEAKRRQDAEQARMQAEQAKAEPERMKHEAELAAQEAARQKEEAEQARQAALSQQRAAEARTQKALQVAAQAENEKAHLRAQLLEQLNSILQTRDSARGLIVNMSDVLFDTGSSTLKPGAREKLAKISGILLARRRLTLQIEGHTDSVGGDDFNQQLSERRSDSVRNFLAEEGVPVSSTSAQGFGKTQPVASNDTPEGRQRNRRVELVVNGDAIGKAAPVAMSSTATP